MTMSIPQTLQGGQSPAMAPQPAAGHTPAAAPPAAAAKAQPAAAPQPQPSSDQIQKAVENLKRIVAPIANNLQFSVDDSTGSTVIRVVDSSTQEVIRQIPSEEMLSLAQDLNKLQGLLFNNKA